MFSQCSPGYKNSNSAINEGSTFAKTSINVYVGVFLQIAKTELTQRQCLQFMLSFCQAFFFLLTKKLEFFLSSWLFLCKFRQVYVCHTPIIAEAQSSGLVWGCQVYVGYTPITVEAQCTCGGVVRYMCVMHQSLLRPSVHVVGWSGICVLCTNHCWGPVYM